MPVSVSTPQPSSPKLGERDDVGGLETWDDPTPRRCAMTLKEFCDIWDAAAQRQLSLRPKSPSREERIRRRQQHDRNSLLIALGAYAKQNNMQPTEFEIVQVKERNLIDERGRGYVHFNFLAKGSDGTPTLFFAEVHPDCKHEEDVYLCTPLKENESGHCFGCNDRAKELMHPTSRGYLGGHEDVPFPFMEMDSDDDDDIDYM